jgi:hypothetical protein
VREDRLDRPEFEIFHTSCVKTLDSYAPVDDNSQTLRGASIRRLGKACERRESRITGRACFGWRAFLGLLLLGLLNLAGCAAFTASLNPSESQATSSASGVQSSSAAAVAPADVSASGAANPVTPAVLPSPLAFGNVLEGVAYAQTLLISNLGSASLSIAQIAASGSGFGVSGISLPLTLGSGQSTSLTVTFESTAVGGAYGNVAISSNAAGSPTTVALSATVGPPSVQLSANPASVSFGSTSVGVSATQNITLTNTGNSTVSISSVSAAGAGFTVSGVPDVTLAPSQAVNVGVIFDPTATGLASGSLAVTSNAPQVQIALSGTGTPAGAPSVNLRWSPSTSVVVGYYVYRGTGTYATLSKLTGAIVPSTSYQDTAVAAGQTYTYALTAVDSAGAESALSTSVTVSIP